MMNYNLEQSSKTRFLNIFRKVFTIPLFEKALVSMASKQPTVLLQKITPPDYLYRKGSIRYAQRDGINFKLDISNVVDHFLYFGIKDNSYQSILNEIKKANVIFDIGANIGSTALSFASSNPAARIIAFEPHPETFSRAIENLRLNNFKNIELLNIGLGEAKATLKLYEVNEHNPGMNRIIAGDKNLPYKNIYVDTLDAIAIEKAITKIDFVKIDVEGYEYSVLAGGKNCIMNSKPILFIELDDDNLKENNSSAKALIDLLISFGYQAIYRADNSMPVDSSTNFDSCHYDIIAR